MRDAPLGARIVVAGVCMEDDLIKRSSASQGAERAVRARLHPRGVAHTLQPSRGRIDVAPLVTGPVRVDGVPASVRDTAKPDAHAKKILVEPWR